MLCPYHTPQCLSSPVLPELLFSFLPQHLSFHLVVTSSAPFSPSPLAPVSCLFAPSQAQTHLGGGHLKWSFPLFFSTSIFSSYLSSQTQSKFLNQPFCIYTWRKITQIGNWCLANPWQQKLGPQSCSVLLWLVHHMFLLLFLSTCIQCTWSQTMLGLSSCKNKSFLSCLILCVYLIRIGFLPLEVKRLPTNRMTPSSEKVLGEREKSPFWMNIKRWVANNSPWGPVSANSEDEYDHLGSIGSSYREYSGRQLTRVALSSSCLCFKSFLEKQNCLQSEMDNQTLLTAAAQELRFLAKGSWHKSISLWKIMHSSGSFQTKYDLHLNFL